jgi:SAM-dependent methyltransferase
MEMNYNRIVQEVIEENKNFPIDLLGIGDAKGEYDYLNGLKDTYIRTVRDIDKLYNNDRGSKNILEIGSFLGPVSISLKRIGYNVSALDIPEFYKSSSLRSLYDKNEIPFIGLNLKHSKLPYESNSFDVVIICEVIEHLNFNPLPIIKEINRVLKIGGYIYISMPNQSTIRNRKNLLLGRSIHNPIDDFFKQLDRNENMIVGLHWREYTLTETIYMLEKMGFETIIKYFFKAKENLRGNGFVRTILNEIVYSYPPFRPFQVVIAKKIIDPNYDFWITEANSS